MQLVYKIINFVLKGIVIQIKDMFKQNVANKYIGPRNSLFNMSVAYFCFACFVMCWLLYRPICQCALKLDPIYMVLQHLSLNISLIYIFLNVNKIRIRCNAKKAMQANRHPCTVSIHRKSRISLMIRFLQLEIRECFERAGFLLNS